jgi:hypothetical protein
MRMSRRYSPTNQIGFVVVVQSRRSNRPRFTGCEYTVSLATARARVTPVFAVVIPFRLALRMCERNSAGLTQRNVN